MEIKLRKFNKFVDKTFIEGGKKAKEPVLLVSVAAVLKILGKIRDLLRI